ncbi:kinesin-like protein Klp61F [Calliopsis andreniformis]|uniref:kinesin-like protein Klp61F n=1 Tax=Calliopsis andreniformis TaxID=337506 RepID=UPI003FCDAF6C
MNNTRTGKKEKSQHIQVFVRVRPINNIEISNKSKNIIEIPNDKELIVYEHPQYKYSRKFKFDNVFGPSSKQIDVYNAIVSPLLEQVLAGYNCTVLAYGQTGTGKTFTMEGINNASSLHWQSDSTAGLIPRFLNHLFDELQLSESSRYRINVNFLELYNEELFDLLSSNDDTSKIRLYEDTSRKGAVIINGLEEVTIHNQDEIQMVLEKGLNRRKTTATLMNAQSSRSHTLFSITVHTKENTIDGEEVLKTGKLNLVDLAGSENVGRSGAIDKRAREAGSVNQSLLTLGRVITALTERAPHVPYRESKLTRLLQESLGGCTKTSVIATISPACINLEKTLSTLDYACRAKNITNRPKINQKLSKKEFLKQYAEEIERLRKDLLATHERSGVHLALDNYNEMQTLIAQQTKEIEEKVYFIKAVEKSMQDKEKIFQEIKLQNIAQEKELNDAKVKLNSTIDTLNSSNYRLKVAIQTRDELNNLVEKYTCNETALLSQAQSLLNVADVATTDSYKLHDKISRKTEAERTFEILGKQFKNDIHECIQGIQRSISTYEKKVEQCSTSIGNDIGTKLVTKCNNIDTKVHTTSKHLTDQYSTCANNVIKNMNDHHLYYQNWIKDEIKNAAGTVEFRTEFLNTVSMKLAESVNTIIQNRIAEDLKLVQNSISKKLKMASIQIHEMIDSACKNEVEASNRLKKKVENIKANIEELRKKQEYTEKQRLFAETMENVYSEFHRLKESQQKHYVIVTNKCNNINEICNKIDDQSTHASNTIVKMKSDLKEEIENNLEKIENTVSVGTDKIENTVNRTAEEGKILLEKLKTNINTSCDALKQYQNLVECNLKEVQRTMDIDKNEYLSVVNNTQKTVEDINNNHMMIVKDQEVKMCNTFKEISEKLENRITESNAWSNNVIEQLHETRDEVNKFFDEDIQRDMPTGSTPPRKEYSYSRQFTVTSPRKLFATSNDKDDSLFDAEITMKQIVNSTAVSDSTFTLSSTDHAMLASTLNTDSVAQYLDSQNSVDCDTLSFSNTSFTFIKSNDSSKLDRGKKFN